MIIVLLPSLSSLAYDCYFCHIIDWMIEWLNDQWLNDQWLNEWLNEWLNDSWWTLTKYKNYECAIASFFIILVSDFAALKIYRNTQVVNILSLYQCKVQIIKSLSWRIFHIRQRYKIHVFFESIQVLRLSVIQYRK